MGASASMFLLEGCEQGRERERLRQRDGGSNKDQPKRWKETHMLTVFRLIATGGHYPICHDASFGHSHS